MTLITGNRAAGLVLVLAAGLVWPAATRAQMTPPPKAEVAQEAAGKGEHNLSGIWNMVRGRAHRYLGDTYTPKPPQLTAWGEAEFKKARSSNSGAYTLEESNDPVIEKCYPPGVPRIYLQPFPFQIAQIPGQVLILYEYDHTVRRIYTDGRALPKSPDPTYMGYSVGHWEGNTLVVETIGFNTKTWLDRLGTPHSEQERVEERFTRVAPNHLEDKITITDPKALVHPWETTLNFGLKPTWNIMEQVCTDNWNFLKFENREKEK